MARYLYFFGDGASEIDPQRKDILGGKGASLIAMSAAGLPVPPGFTISAECCPIYLETGRWPQGLEEEVRAAMARLEKVTGRAFGAFPKPLLVSVRSGAAVSMPGMMDTLLNCGIHEGMTADGRPGVWEVYCQFTQMFAKTVAEIPISEFDQIATDLAHQAGRVRHDFGNDDFARLAKRFRTLYCERAKQPFPETPWQALHECIEAVFRSWNSVRAKAYRKQHDIREAFGTAVTVQSMFPSQASGIVFTANPNDATTERMIVEASFGLGESVVSGDVTPDRFGVDRKSFAVVETAIGNKTHVVRALGDTNEYDPHGASLSAAQLSELAGMSLKVEDYFKAPVDLEWGWADGRFNLLQARPIRGLDIVRDVETCRKEEIARLSGLANGSRRCWVTYNLGETLPAPTPMTWDVMRRFMSGSGGFGRMYRDFGFKSSARVLKDGFLDLICGRIYADPDRAAELFWAQMPLEYDQEAVMRDRGALEAAPTKFNPEKAGPSFFLRLPGTLVAMLRSARRMKKARRLALERFEREILPPYLDYVKTKRAQDLSRLSLSQLHQELLERQRVVLDDFGGESLKPGFFGGVARASLEQTLVQLAGDQEGKRFALELTMGLDGDVTIEQNEALYRLARGQGDSAAYLERFGHRTAGEMELAEPRWREDRSYLETLMEGCRSEAARDPAQMHHANAEIRKQREADLPGFLAKYGGSALLEDLQVELKDAQRLLPFRENGKFYLMMGYELIRLILLEYSRRWNLGRDVFFLHLDELERYPSERERLDAQNARRKVRWQAAKRLEVADVIDSRHLAELGLPQKHAAASELSGDSIAPGVYTGKARIVFDPKEASHLEAGAILVCPSTDPGWTVLFMRAKGLIVEKGGVLSHGAIVARDFGIPAVVCNGATRRIKDGDMIRVDGNRGAITILNGKGA